MGRAATAHCISNVMSNYLNMLLDKPGIREKYCKQNISSFLENVWIKEKYDMDDIIKGVHSSLKHHPKRILITELL